MGIRVAPLAVAPLAVAALAVAAFVVAGRAGVAPLPPDTLRPPEYLVAEGFRRARVVIMNEAHDGPRRSPTTRAVGARVLATARAAGATHLAMEALSPFGSHVDDANAARDASLLRGPYFAHDDLRAFAQTALDLGFMLVAYEQADVAPGDVRALSATDRLAAANARDDAQAANLANALAAAPPDAKWFVWCGGSHGYKATVDGWTFMAARFAARTGVVPFSIDQLRAIRFRDDAPPAAILRRYGSLLARMPLRAGGFFVGEVDDPRFGADVGVDAFVVSLDDGLS